MKIRYATSNDIDLLTELNAREYWNNLESWINATTEERWQEAVWWADPKLLYWYISILRKCDGGIVVAEKDNRIIAQLDFVKSFDHISNFRGYRYHIIWILTDPDFRRQGIAQEMIEYLMDDIDLPVWVEPEDTRSEKMYAKLGQQIFSISNWSLKLEQITDYILDHRKEADIIAMKELGDLDNSYQLLVGRYYAPCYDYNQIMLSDPVAKFMWGNTQFPNVHHYQLSTTNIYAIMTQYPRIWVNNLYNRDELQEILAAISLYLFEMGFDEIFLQVYNESGLEPVISSLGYVPYIEHDPVYQLTP